MLFNSIEYMLFLPFVVVIYFLLNSNIRWLFLLTMSYLFYMSWNVQYAFLMLLSTLITFVAGLFIGNEKKIKRKKIYVGLSFVSNLWILFFFKYFNFFAESIEKLSNFFDYKLAVPNLDVLLPVGISFYTFQALSYTVDVYRNDIKPTNHFGKYALFVSFFPQLVAGPIEKSKNLLYQFDEIHEFDYDRMKRGLIRIVIGLIKKMVIADRLSLVVDAVYNFPGDYSGGAYLIATVFFAFQIYCDFSAYSDIAIGSADIMGYRLMQNFNLPYFSKSISEFWKKWHISLSTWFKEYLYIPLGGNRVILKKWVINTFIVFAVSGLWHGANWTFVTWGVLHGIYLVIERFTRQHLKTFKSYVGIVHNSRLDTLISVLCTFILTDFAWIFFRANSIEDAMIIAKGILFNLVLNRQVFYSINVSAFELNMCLISIIVLLFFQVLYRKSDYINIILNKSLPVRWFIYMTMVFTIFMFGIYGGWSDTSFIYFQF